MLLAVYRGNRLEETRAGKTTYYRYNDANQLVQQGDTLYDYDDNGNRISEKNAEGVRRFSYNEDNFLLGMEDVHGKITNYGYDALNRRIAKTSGAATTEYLYDGLAVVNEVTDDGRTKLYNLAGGKIVSLSLGLQQGANAKSPIQNPSTEKLFYSYDGLGSVAGLSDAKGNRQTRYHYDAFGELIDGDTTVNEYTYTGKRLDPEIGLYHFHFRQYDPGAGVWTTPDPIGILGGVNLYGYVGANPVNLKDRFGLWGADGTGGGEDSVSGESGGMDSDQSISSPGNEVSSRTDIPYIDITNPKLIPDIDDVITPGTLIDVATAIATTFAEKGGSISSGIAIGLGFILAPLSDLVLPATANMGEDELIRWEDHMREIRAKEKFLDELLDRLEELHNNSGGHMSDCKE